MKPQGPHRFRIQQVSSVKDDRRPHFFLHHSQVDISKFVPFRGDDQRFGIAHRLESGRSKFGCGDRFYGAGLLYSFRVIGDHMRSFAQQVCDQLDRNRRTNIVCIWLECETPDRNSFFPKNPQRFTNRFQKTLFLGGVYSLHFLQQIERNTEPFADRNECSNVFGKTRAAVSNPSIKKITANAMIHSNPVRDFFDIGATRLANRRDRVDV